MGSLRKFFASVSLFALLFTISGINTIARAFGDVPAGAYYESALEWAVSEGVVDDAPNFRPGANLQRDEMAKMVVAALGVPMDTTDGPSFTDVSESSWSYSYVETGVANGLFTGYTDADGLPTGKYGPADNATRAAVVKVLMLAYGFEDAECDSTFSDVDYSAWYGKYMDSACHYGIITQGRPSDLITRAEFVTMLSRAANYTAPTEEEEEEVVEEEEEEEVVLPASEGDLTVAVAPSTPMAGTIPADAASVDFSTFAFTAEGDDVAVNGVTLWRDGLGSHSDFSQVWVAVDGFKVGSERSLNSDQNAVVNLSRDYIVVPDGETVLVDVKGSMGTSVGANRSNRLGFRSAADIDTNAASVAGSFPLYGNYMTTSSYTVGSVAFTDDGSATTVDVGDVQAIIGEFAIENQSDNNENFVLSTLDFEINGSGSFDNLANAQIYYLGEVVSDTVTPFDDHLRFTFEDGGFLLEDGDTEDFEIKADIVKGDDGDTIILGLDEDNDLTVYVADTGYNYAVDVTRTDTTLDTYTINAGTITFARDVSSPSATDITDDIDGVTFLIAQVSVGEDIKVTETRVYLDGTFTTGTDGSTAITTAQCTTEATLYTVLDDKLDDVKIWDGSRLVAGGQNTLADAATATPGTFASSTCTVADAYYSFTDNYDLNAGTHLLSVTADVSQYMAADETVSLSFDNTPSAWIEAEYVLSGDDVAAADVNGSASGSTFTIESATLTLTRQDGFSSGEDIVKGSQDIVLLTFKLENNDAGDVTVTDLDIQDSTTDVDGTLLTGLGLYESGTDNLVVNSLQDLGSDDTLSFDGMSLTVPSGGFTLLDVRGTVSTSWNVSSDIQLYVTGVNAKDVNNNDATITYNTILSGASSANALAFTLFDVNDSAQVTVAFKATNDFGSDYTNLILPTGTCADGSCATEVARLEFHAIYDDVLLKRLLLKNDESTDSFTYNQRFGTFYLVDESTGDTIATASMNDDGTNDGYVLFSGFTYEIPRDEYFVVNVMAEVLSITKDTQTGSALQLYMAAPSATTGSTIELVSDATGSNLLVTDSTVLTDSATDGAAYQQTHFTRKAVPSFTYNNGSVDTSVGSTVSGTEIYRFKMAATGGTVEWKRLTFNVTETVLTSSNYLLYIAGQSSPLNTAASVDSGEVRIEPSSTQSVSAGSTVEYVLKATITVSTSTAAQSLAIQLAGTDDDAANIGSGETGAEDYVDADDATRCESTYCDFIWSDRSAQVHTTTSSSVDWFNGYQVDGLDTETVNIFYDTN